MKQTLKERLKSAKLRSKYVASVLEITPETFSRKLKSGDFDHEELRKINQLIALENALKADTEEFKAKMGETKC